MIWQEPEVRDFLGGSDSKASAYDLGDWVQSLGREDLLEKGMATHSSILAWKIPWTETGGLQSMGLQRVGHNFTFFHLRSERGTDLPLPSDPGCRSVIQTGLILWASSGSVWHSSCRPVLVKRAYLINDGCHPKGLGPEMWVHRGAASSPPRRLRPLPGKST